MLVAARLYTPPVSETWHGRTQYGRAVTLYLVDHEPRSFYTSAIVTCPRSRYTQRFAPRDPVVPFDFAHRQLALRDTWTNTYERGWVGHGTTTMRANVGDDSATGTVWMVQSISGPGEPYACESGPVTFSARAG